jgi:Terminase large subunit, ATPase domain
MSTALDFFRREIVLDTGDRFGDVAAEWQLDILEAIDSGARRFAWIEAPRGYAKTSLLAMVALGRLILGEPGQRVYAAAGDRDQARLLADELRGYVRRNSRLASGLNVSAYRAELPAKDNVLEVLTADAPTSWGLKPTLVLVDEVTVWRNRELFDSLLSATGKMAGAQLLAISNAGTLGSWQWDLREVVRTDEDWLFRTLEPGQAPWISDKWIESQRRILPPPVFDRVILNKWGTGEGAFFEPAQVARCVVPAADFNAELLRRAVAKVAIGVDLGVRHDATALAVVGCDQEGRAVVLDLAVFQPDKGAEVSLEGVEDAITSLYQRWNASAVVFDPHQARLMMQRIQGTVKVVEHPFTSASVEKLSKVLFERVSQGKLRFAEGAGRTFVNGQEWTLERELSELQYCQTSYGFKQDHRPHGFNDRVTAAALGLWHLSSESLAAPFVFYNDTPEPPADQGRSSWKGGRPHGRHIHGTRFEVDDYAEKRKRAIDALHHAADKFNNGGI